MKKVQFNLNGKSVSVGGPGPQGQRIIDFIKGIPNGKYYDIPGIAKCLNLSIYALDKMVIRNVDELEGYFLVVPNSSGGGRKKIYGNKASIQKLAKQLQEQDII